MKIKWLFIVFLSYGILTVINISYSYNEIIERSRKDSNVKCYVELIGGSETISFWRIERSVFTRLPMTIVGQDVFIFPKPKSSVNKKGTVYKVKECTLVENEFSSIIAKAIEKRIPR